MLASVPLIALYPNTITQRSNSQLVMAHFEERAPHHLPQPEVHLDDLRLPNGHPHAIQRF